MRTSPDMWASLLIFFPVGLVLGLLAFGDHGGPRLAPTRANLFAVGFVALLAGPVAVALVGIVMWLLCVALFVSLLTMVAVLREPRRPAHRHG